MANPEQHRSRTILLSVAGLVLFAALIYAIHSLTRTVVPVQVVQVTRQDLLSTVSTNGKVEPVDGAAFQAHAPGPGIVAKIYVDVGQHVKPGTLLIGMKDADAQARVASARSSLAAAELSSQDISNGGSAEELQRFRQDIASAQTDRDHAAAELATEQALKAQGAASTAEVTAKQQRLQTAEFTLKTAKDRLVSRFGPRDLASQRARVADAQAAIVAAKGGLAAYDIHSPIAGTVYSIPVSPFDFVRDGDDLMDVADLNRIQIRAYFDEPEIGKLTPGQPVKIVWDAKRDKVWHGHISRAPTTVIPYGTRSVGEALITVDDAKEDLPPNSNVTVTVTTNARDKVLSVPREALHTEGDSDFVYRIVDHHLVRTSIKAGVVSNTDVEIVSGLRDGDQIVLHATSAGQDLTDGLEVKRVP